MIGLVAINVVVGIMAAVGALLSPDVAAYGGLLIALLAAYASVRTTGPNRQKILAEAGSVADRRVLEWADRIAKENKAMRKRELWLEERVDQLEACLRNAGIPVPQTRPAPE